MCLDRFRAARVRRLDVHKTTLRRPYLPVLPIGFEMGEGRVLGCDMANGTEYRLVGPPRKISVAPGISPANAMAA